MYSLRTVVRLSKWGLALCVLLQMNVASQTSSLFLPKECWVKKHSRIQHASDRSQAELDERAGLFKGLKSAVQMLNFVVFHLFPVLNVLANDIWVTSGELGKSWDSVLVALPRSGLLPWTLMSDSRNEMLRPKTKPDQYSLIFSLSVVLYWGLRGLGGVRFSLLYYMPSFHNCPIVWSLL